MRKTNPFRSRLEAMQRARKVWVCRHCHKVHYDRKPRVCSCTNVGFHKFDSDGEYKRFCDLVTMQRAGYIHGLRCQVPFCLYAGRPGTLTTQKSGKPVLKYIADFCYEEDGYQVVEDYKGSVDAAHHDGTFKIKRKLIEVAYDIQIKIVSYTSRSETCKQRIMKL